jgi:glucose-1-phosphate thymidylyltransferase
VVISLSNLWGVALHGSIQDIETVQRMQNVMVANLEEIAWRMGYISEEAVRELAQPLKKNAYGKYLLKLVGDK